MKFIFKFVAVFLFTFEYVRCATPKELIQEEWETFKAEYKKVYASKFEEKFRMKVYMDNRLKVAQLNRNGTYKVAMNKYGDLLRQERHDMLNGYREDLDNLTEGSGATFLPPLLGVSLPSYVNWVGEGYVSPVKDQKDCGSGWAFAAAGALEGQMARLDGSLLPLSAQDLLDCSSRNNGCRGGSADLAFLDIQEKDGIDRDDSYPYEGVQKQCRYSRIDRGATDLGFVLLKPNSEKVLQMAVATVGPIAVGLDASHDGFAFYKSGIYTDKNCDPSYLNHQVLVVGYGTENDQDFWLVKNSWGEDWGDNGYIKMARNNGNQCGIAAKGSFPLVQKT